MPDPDDIWRISPQSIAQDLWQSGGGSGMIGDFCVMLERSDFRSTHKKSR
ncbi:hypothetical protein CEV34_3248 [Brucella pseudogrignonensis]|uniref:Uncharacterized protein n=1 Tax=Brucella pseudogrignonensis TaxID=419475 RepID=A0A256G9V9_9HYPH|nr:hypothetical protein CEV34_3248 [Brucella pseudogrignonensis]